MAKVGDTIMIQEMLDEDNYTNRMGVITHIDDDGQIHGTWGGLAVIPEKDKFIVLKGEENEK